MLPQMIVQAILGYQKVINGEGWNTLQEVRESMERLETGYEQMEDVIIYMFSWDGPQHFRRAWVALEEVMVGSVEGPMKRYMRMRDDLEEAEEEGKDADEIVEIFGYHIEEAKEGCEMMLEAIQKLDDANECMTRKNQQRA